MGYTIEEIRREINNLDNKKVNSKNNSSLSKKNNKTSIKAKKRSGFRTFVLGVLIYFALSNIEQLQSLGYHLSTLEGTTISNEFSEEEIENKLEKVKEVTKDNTEDNENLIIIYAAIENENLTEYEKSIVYNFVDLIKDNPYINKDKAYKSLSNVDVVYTTRDGEYPDSVMGVYLLNENLIKIFTAENNTDKNVLIHEFIHCLYYNSNTINLPSYFTEGVTELLTNEYFADSAFLEIQSYPIEITMVKTLADLVGSDIILESFSTGNMNLVQNELSNIMGKAESIKFLNNLNNIFIDFNDNQNINQSTYNEIMNFLDESFAIKGKNDSTILESYAYNREILTLLSSTNPYYDFVNYIYDNGIYIKPYFSSKLKEKYPSPYQTTYFDGKELNYIPFEYEKKQ